MWHTLMHAYKTEWYRMPHNMTHDTKRGLKEYLQMTSYTQVYNAACVFIAWSNHDATLIIATVDKKKSHFKHTLVNL